MYSSLAPEAFLIFSNAIFAISNCLKDQLINCSSLAITNGKKLNLVSSFLNAFLYESMRCIDLFCNSSV